MPSCPPFLPEAPQPIVLASHNATEYPFFARFNALVIPVKPPPIIHISMSRLFSKLSPNSKGFTEFL